MRIIVQKFLEFLVRIKLRRTTPVIVGVTGSVGKTSTKEAIYEVLKTKWRVYRNPKSLNTEIGLLLAVLEQPSGFRSPIKWVKIITRAIVNAFSGKKYDYLVLEYGADKPGDISHLISLVKPHIAVITRIARIHQALGQFKSEEDVFNEKKKLVMCLGTSDVAILNKKDLWLRKLEDQLKAKILWFGEKDSDIFAGNLSQDTTGFSAEIHVHNQKIPAYFPILGSYHIDVMLPALLVGQRCGIEIKEGLHALKSFKLPPGRMSRIEGKNGTIILDGSYNASPEAVKQAINLLCEFPGGKKVAVLGNMNELGDYTDKAHREIGDFVAKSKINLLITVGEFAQIIAEEALKKGFFETNIKLLRNANEASALLESLIASKKISSGDVILFKGSQNRVRLERAVKALMANPKDAKHLLCRQEPEWEEIE